MLIGSSASRYRAKVLCVRSSANASTLDAILNHYDVTVVHDGNLASRKARYGVYDCYVAVDARTAKGAAYVWQAIREFDKNTPFVMFAAEPLPADVESRFRAGFDAYVRYPTEEPALYHIIERMLDASEHRSLDARVTETAIIARELNTRLDDLSRRVPLSKQSLARAQEHVMRAYALRAFAECGGTRSIFERYWPEMFESTLRDSSSGATEDGRVDEPAGPMPRR